MAKPKNMTPEQEKEWEEKVKARDKAYREANKEKKKAYAQAYREANKEKLAEKDKARREANPEKMKAYAQAYREANKEKAKATTRDWYKANKERARDWYKANRERYKARNDARQSARVLLRSLLTPGEPCPQLAVEIADYAEKIRILENEASTKAEEKRAEIEAQRRALAEKQEAYDRRKNELRRLGVG